MGLILDSSVLVKAERQGQNVRQMLTALSRAAGETEIAMSVVTLVELDSWFEYGGCPSDREHARVQKLLVNE
jgi:predicted nucleic acid-binding protein